VSDAELELQLGRLAAAVEFPPAPDLRAAVRASIERPQRSRLRWVALAAVVLVVLLGALLAVPSARTTLFRWLGIEGVTLSFVERLPTGAVRGRADLGVRAPFAKARARAAFQVVDPPASLGTPAVYYRVPPLGGLVTFLYGTPARARLLLSELKGDYRPFFLKTIAQSTTTEELEIDGVPALWIQGAHSVEYADLQGNFESEPLRLANRVLLWEHGGVTFRLEGRLTRDEAVRIAKMLIR
jgi:hypothetical protein